MVTLVLRYVWLLSMYLRHFLMKFLRSSAHYQWVTFLVLCYVKETTFFIIVDIIHCNWGKVSFKFHLDPLMISLLSCTNYNGLCQQLRKFCRSIDLMHTIFFLVIPEVNKVLKFTPFFLGWKTMQLDSHQSACSPWNDLCAPLCTYLELAC